MKTRITMVVMALLVVAVLASCAYAQDTKTAIAWSGTEVVPAMAAAKGIAADADGYVTVLSGWVHTGSPKDVSVLFTAESMLATYVQVRTSKDAGGSLVADSDTSQGCIKIKCLVDGQAASPDEVTFDSRLMRLSAFLGEAIYTVPGTTMLASAGNQWISVYENTAQSHAFNFLRQNLGSGDHFVEIKAKVKVVDSKYLGQPTGGGDPDPMKTEAYLGKSTMIVDEVNLKGSVYPAQ